MGSILIKTGLQTKRLFLLDSNGFGRSPELGLGQIKLRMLPLFWLEIRWMNGQWLWRALNGEDSTVGKGTVITMGWRQFIGSIKYDSFVEIELLQDTPPIILIENITQKKRSPIQEFNGLHVSDLGYHLEVDSPLLQNGEIFVLEGMPYRIWIPQYYVPSRESICAVSTDGYHLDLYAQSLKAVFSWPHHSVELVGEYVRVLILYALERKNSDEGWINTQEAYEVWLELGGNANSPIKRLSWERNKLRASLLENKVSQVDSLFERQRHGTQWSHRFTLNPENITIIE